MPRKRTTRILDDQPTDQDALDFSPYARTLINVCRTAGTPLTIGVFGGWGTGKTSLMKMVRAGLPRHFTVAWFDAWKYDNEETLWRSFLLTILLAIEDHHKKEGQPLDELQTLKTLLYRGMEIEKLGGVTIDLSKLMGQTLQGVVQLGLSFVPPLAQLTKLVETLQTSAAKNIAEEATDAIRRERTQLHIEQVRSLEQFQEKFAALVDNYVARGQNPGRLVVFIDDLDRCLPEKAVQVLEAIKLFADAPHCVFILGLDQGVIARGVEVRYKDFFKNNDDRRPIDGAQYLEKIIQVPFAIPPVEQASMHTFVSGLTPEWPADECPAVFALALGSNPRQIKRTVNVFLLLWQLVSERKLEKEILPVRLAKVVAIQSIARDLYARLVENPLLLGLIEQYFRSEPDRKGNLSDESEVSTTVSRPSVQLAEDLLNVLNAVPAVRSLLLMHPAEQKDLGFAALSLNEISVYFTLTRRVEVLPSQPVESQRRPFEPQMVTVPAGPFRMGSKPDEITDAIRADIDQKWIAAEVPQHEVQLGEYAIAKYPVTNRDYQPFVLAGHRPPKHWSGGTFPESAAAHPVVNVSWDDAAAYCQWLREETGRHYRLPSEAEWEKAARGTDGRIFPWGNEFDAARANTKESGSRTTTPVGQFSPAGDSPYGCADMIGNVWEWCSDWYDEKLYTARAGQLVQDPFGPEQGQLRVARGGSWYGTRDGARCASRLGLVPDSYGNGLGFRLVLSPRSSSENLDPES